VKSNHARRIGHEIRKRVDVVIELAAVAVIDDIFNAADLNARPLHDALDIFNDLPRGIAAFHLQAGLRGVHGAGDACQFLAPGALADVRGAQIECLAGGVNADRVKKFAAQDLDTGDDLSRAGKNSCPTATLSIPK